MSNLDLITYISQNAKVPMSMLLVSILISIPLSFLLFAGIENPDKITPGIIKRSCLLGLVPFYFGLLAFVPTHEKLLALKIAKIKNELVTKENTKKGIDRLDEVLEKLECKYLNICKGDK